MKVDCDYIGYEVSWEDSLLDGVDNFIHMVPQHAVLVWWIISKTVQDRAKIYKNDPNYLNFFYFFCFLNIFLAAKLTKCRLF